MTPSNLDENAKGTAEGALQDLANRCGLPVGILSSPVIERLS